MNWDQIAGDWKQVKGAVRKKWGKLTDDDVDVIAGKRDILLDKIQERHGVVREDAEKELKAWEASLTIPIHIIPEEMAMTIEEYKKILQMAIGNEIAAHDFYKGVSEKTKDDNLRSIFSEMAEAVKKHKTVLEGFISGAKPLQFSTIVDYKVSETVEKPKLSINMKPADAIALVMKEEEEAMQMYQGLADSSANPEQGEMFLALARMKEGHKIKLEKLYTPMAFPEVW